MNWSTVLPALNSIVGGLIMAVAIWALVTKKVIRPDELVTADKNCKDRDELRLQQIADRDEENDRLLAANAALAAELKEQSRTMAEQTREVFNAVKMLQSLAGLAAQERRRSGDD